MVETNNSAWMLDAHNAIGAKPNIYCESCSRGGLVIAQCSTGFILVGPGSPNYLNVDNPTDYLLKTFDL